MSEYCTMVMDCGGVMTDDPVSIFQLIFAIIMVIIIIYIINRLWLDLKNDKN